MTNNTTLPVMEHFYTLQGEGHHSGRAAYFIRLAGCDVGCVWCDVKESWEISPDQYMTIEEIVAAVGCTPTDFVVLTGGEPTMHSLEALCNALHAKGYEVAIETAGVHPLRGQIDWYCFSPKKFKAPITEAYTLANELKVVIAHPSDFEWAEKHAALVGTNCLLYLQTEWDKQARFLPLIIDYIKCNKKWKISLQTHKYMQIP
ncbi:MAG: 7-carboxy-7-deazaguanine synthase QueE [Flavobacteriales bacterium]